MKTIININIAVIIIIITIIMLIIINIIMIIIINIIMINITLYVLVLEWLGLNCVGCLQTPSPGIREPYCTPYIFNQHTHENN